MNIRLFKKLPEIFTSFRKSKPLEQILLFIIFVIAQSFVIMKIISEIGIGYSDFGCKRKIFSVYNSHNNLTES